MDYQKNYLDELAEYVKKNLKKGYTKESLKWALIEQGNSKMEVEKALIKVDKELAQQAPILRTKPMIKYEIVESNDFLQKESFFNRIANGFRRLF
jgi:SOS response regulatory protein OraA/RecX